jgi:hypothetical protein
VNDEAARQGRSADNVATSLAPLSATPCNVCGGHIRFRCVLCAGHPENRVTLERLARDVAEIDRAVRNYRRAA